MTEHGRQHIGDGRKGQDLCRELAAELGRRVDRIESGEVAADWRILDIRLRLERLTKSLKESP